MRGLTLTWMAMVSLLTVAAAQQRPTPETASWWATTTALANDGMEGRDTGTAAYQRAAEYVAEQFRAAGLKPAGDAGTFFQRVAMRETDLDVERSFVEVESSAPGSDSVGIGRFKLMEQVTVQASPALPLNVRANMMFVGYGDEQALRKDELRGRIVVYFAGAPVGQSGVERLAFNGARAQRLAALGAEAVVAILNPADTEPFHWPAAYARTVTLADAPGIASSVPAVRMSAEAAGSLFAYSGHNFGDLLKAGGRGETLPSFPLPAILHMHLETTSKDIASPNILAVLPGSDPRLAGEYVALSAHLDGYGYGTPVAGDNLYNGALDDAAYVALLIEVAKNLHAKAPGRSLLFCAFTGEEKGLLGSASFTAHPTVPVGKIVADLNLDQLRPIFSLKILTMEGLGDSTLGATAKAVAGGMGIEVREDREPERNLFRRADNWSFVKVGVPIAGFIFGYDPGTREEEVYRDWYARRYHKPQDDLGTPIDWEAAAKFNRFYERLAVTVANAAEQPAWTKGSAYAPK